MKLCEAQTPLKEVILILCSQTSGLQGLDVENVYESCSETLSGSDVFVVCLCSSVKIKYHKLVFVTEIFFCNNPKTNSIISQGSCGWNQVLTSGSATKICQISHHLFLLIAIRMLRDFLPNRSFNMTEKEQSVVLVEEC